MSEQLKAVESKAKKLERKEPEESFEGFTHKDLLGLFQTFQAVSQLESTSVAFSYAVAKNLRRIRQECNDIMAATKPSPRFIEYDKKRLDLCKEYAKKNHGDDPVIENGEFVFEGESKEQFHAKLLELKLEYKDALDEREAAVEKQNTFLSDEADKEFLASLHRIKLSQVPSGIRSAQLEQLLPLIIEDVPISKLEISDL